MAARDNALATGTQPQIHDCALAVQLQEREDKALELFRINIRKDPESWVGRNEAARLDMAKGDYAAAAEWESLRSTFTPSHGTHACLK